MNIDELKEMLDEQKKSLEAERDRFSSMILQKANSIAIRQPTEINHALVSSVIRDIEVYNLHLRDIESELKVVEHYRWHTRDRVEG